MEFKYIENYKSDFEGAKRFELVDCLESVDLFLRNLNRIMILRFTEQIFDREDFRTCRSLDNCRFLDLEFNFIEI